MDNAAVIASHVNYLRRINARLATLKHRRDNLNRLTRALPVPLLAATPSHLDDWQAQLCVSISSIATYTSHVRALYRWAWETELLDADPARRLLVPKVPPRMPRPIPERDLALALRTAVRQPRLFIWLCLAGYCGLRACEVAAVSREDANNQSVRFHC